MRLIFAGSPAIAVPVLEVLAREGGGDWELAGALTNPDSKRGRSGRLEPTEIGAAAEALSAELAACGRPPLALLKPERLDGGAREAVGALKPDLLVSFAYGRIFGPRFLALFPLGGINIHPSLLPRYRGPAPIPAAILNREAETGITIQRLAAEMDCGDILVQDRFPLSGRETAGELGAFVARRSAALIGPALRDLGRGVLRGRPQNHGEAAYCSLLSKEDGRISWAASAAEIDGRVRAFNPWPLAWTTHGGELLYILEASPWDPAHPGAAHSGAASSGGEAPGTVLGADKRGGILVQTGDGVLAVSRLQYGARKALDWRAFLNGARNFTGSRLGQGTAAGGPV